MFFPGDSAEAHTGALGIRAGYVSTPQKQKQRQQQRAKKPCTTFLIETSTVNTSKCTVADREPSLPAPFESAKATSTTRAQTDTYICVHMALQNPFLSAAKNTVKAKVYESYMSLNILGSCNND